MFNNTRNEMFIRLIPFINMASNSNLAADVDSEDAVISMVDYLKEEEELENDAHAVLGGSDEHHCTYPMVINSSCGGIP